MGNQRDEVLKKRYFMEGETCTDHMFHRVAKHLSYTNEEYDRFYDVMSKLYFIPNTPCLVNAGNPSSSGQLMACFVLPVMDSMDGIFTTLHDMALIQKTGGGTGFNFASLRPSSAPVSSTLGVASGPISFMKAYDACTETVKQGGVRRGANMGMMTVSHPEITNFITCKTNPKELNNFNLSVAITDDFLAAVAADAEWQLTFDGVVFETMKARELMDMLVYQAWLNGEPGVIFLDEINRKHTLPGQKIEATNPCGEQPLLPFEACCLGGVNLSMMVDKPAGSLGVFNYERFEMVIKTGVRILDNMLDKNKYPLPIIEETCKKNRKIGLGIMGYADMLIKMGLKYGSDEAMIATMHIAEAYEQFAQKASHELAIERGCFPAWEQSVWSEIKYEMRNATVTTIAPTGTTSIIGRASNGIEPIFAPVTILNRMDTTFVELHPLIEDMLTQWGLLKEFMSEEKPDINHFMPALGELILTAHDVSPTKHVEVQAIWQRYVHNAVSKTINMPNSSTEEDVREVLMLAHKLQCKGTTVYRDGSRTGQVFNKEAEKKEEPIMFEATLEPTEPEIRDRPEITNGFTKKVKIGCGNLYVTVNHDEFGTSEVFTNTGKAGGCPSQSEATARVVSIALRHGIDPKELIEQLKGIRCGSCTRNKAIRVTSCPDAIAKALMIAEGIGHPDDLLDTENPYSAQAEYFAGLNKLAGANLVLDEAVMEHSGCPECGRPLEHEGGCVVCQCGYSKCG